MCAEYIRSLLLDKPLDIAARAQALRFDGGEKFFNPDTQEIFPEADFAMCVDYDKFPFVLRIEKNADGRAVSHRTSTLGTHYDPAAPGEGSRPRTSAQHV